MENRVYRVEIFDPEVSKWQLARLTNISSAAENFIKRHRENVPTIKIRLLDASTLAELHLNEDGTIKK